MKAITLLVVAIFSIAFIAADWPQFRGESSSSVAADSKLPTDWTDSKHVAWKVELTGRGASSPIVVKDRVFVTASSGFRHDRLHVLCFDADSGKQLWERSFWATGRTSTHSSISCAAPTPASDGESIFAFYSSNDLFCLDLDGNLRWYRGLAFDFPKAGNDIGMASSPVVADGIAIVQIESQGDSFAAGIDAANGETRWKVDRVKRSNWASPIILPGKGKRKTAVLLQSSDRLSAHELQTGEELWSFESDCSTTPSSVVAGDLLLAPTGGLTAFRLSDESNSAEIVWDSNRVRPGAASPVVFGDRVITLSGGIVKAADIENGDLVWSVRLKGRHWATPVIANGHMYCISGDGIANVIQLSEDEGKVVSNAEFGEIIQGTPAIANDAMFVRSDDHLWKIAQ